MNRPEGDAQFNMLKEALNEESRLYFEGYNYREIAALCGFRSKATAKTRIDNSANNLRSMLGTPPIQRKRLRMVEKMKGQANKTGS